MADDHNKQRFYPLKPRKREGFKKAVAWLGGRELIVSLKGTIIYAIYGENMDPRSWMKANIYPNVEEKVKYAIEEKKKSQTNELNSVAENQAAVQVKENKNTQDFIRDEVNKEWARKIYEQWKWKKDHYGFWAKYQDPRKKLSTDEKNIDENNTDEKTDKDEKPIDEFWFDYIADTGDGQLGVYGVACMCLSDLWIKDLKVGSEVRFAPPELKENGETVGNFELLPRGNYLFVGGDTAYHSANYETLFERFQTPFRWAFMSVRKYSSKKYELIKTDTEKFFLLDGTRKNVFKNSVSTEPVPEWDGTIGNIIDGKLYWDTEPLRPLFGVPANHDYYDSIDGFNKQFRRPPFEQIEENMVYEDDKGRMFLQIPTFAREQEASYVALHLPFDWWLFGIDSENEKLDYRQELFFKQIMKSKPTKLIITTPEPTTVFGKISSKNAKTTKYLRSITESLGLDQPFLVDGTFDILPTTKNSKNRKENVFDRQMESEVVNKSLEFKFSEDDKYCRLDISGDVHHYARYWGENTRKFDGDDFWAENYASLVAGGGGAFFDSTETLIGKTFNSNDKRIRKDGFGKEVRGEIPPQRVFPGEEASLKRMSDRLFDLWNIKKGGYVQLAGAVISVIIYFLLTHFSNASVRFLEINKHIRADGLFYGIDQTANPIQKILYSRVDEYGPFITGVFLTAVAVLIFSSANKLNQLITELKEKSFENRIDDGVDGGLKQLLTKFIPFFTSLFVYFLFILGLGIKADFKPDIVPFTKSFFLLVHFIITGLLIWLSMDFANWLPIRFKLTRNSAEKTYLQKVEDPNETSTKWYEFLLGQYSREFSYRYIPSYILVVLAFANLIFGIRVFGDESLSRTFGDLLLMIIVLGGLAVISYMLAVNTGAAYHDQSSERRKFFLIGLFHALLQLFTPFIIYFYADKWYLLLLAAVVLFFNGIPFSSSRIKTFPFLKNLFGTDSILYKITDFQGAALIMTRGKGKWKLITFFWAVYGLMFLVLPFLIIYLFNGVRSIGKFVFPNSRSLAEFVYAWTAYFINPASYEQQFRWVYLGVSIAVVAYVGYYMSRVWFSWYLAVSLAFNGHNNEAGGAARIEGFKHILRIKVKEDQLTVYVIGFEEAEHELDKLKLKLVDKFTLKCRPII